MLDGGPGKAGPLQIAVGGLVNLGIISCRDLVPDLWRIADGFNVALEELLECAAPA